MQVVGVEIEVRWVSCRGFQTVLVADRVDEEYFTSATVGEVYNWEDILDVRSPLWCFG